MKRVDASEAHDLETLVARALFQDQFPMRSWDGSKGYLQANAKKRASTALKRAGIENVELRTKIVQKENRHYGDGLGQSGLRQDGQQVGRREAADDEHEGRSRHP